ncbi:MAG: hypothetical protein ACJA2W_002156 [Planctomycetota bacterium]|jgi:hypothetical protein
MKNPLHRPARGLHGRFSLAEKLDLGAAISVTVGQYRGNAATQRDVRIAAAF